QRFPGNRNYQALRNSFGETGELENTPFDLRYLVKKLKAEGRLPHFWMSTGTEDPLYGESKRFREFLVESGVDFAYMESPGVHSWDVFDVHLKALIDMWF
ncbi:MAG: acetylesterase, partial [Clostridia bacterium]|nr:acetylesterase [Clostridia bacterium]